MQLSSTRHLSEVSIARTAGSGFSFTGSNGDSDASCTRVSGGSGSATGTSMSEGTASARAGAGTLRWDDTAALEALAVAGSATMDSRAWPNDVRLLRVANRCSIGIAMFSMLEDPRPLTAAAPKPANATVPLNTAKTATCEGLIRFPSLRRPDRLAPQSSLAAKSLFSAYDQRPLAQGKKVVVNGFSEKCCANITCGRQPRPKRRRRVRKSYARELSKSHAVIQRAIVVPSAT